LIAAVRRLKLAAAIAQPPDESRQTAQALRQGRFQPERWQGVNTATLLVDLRPGLEVVEQSMRRRTLQEIRQAVRRGVRIQEVGDSAVPVFFELMAATCRRQHTSPQPASAQALGELWSAFAQRGQARLSLASIQDTPVAGQLVLCFGRRATFWKKGWTEDSGAAHPVTLLTHESLRWAQSAGFHWVDFAALDPDLAATLIAGREPTESQRRSRHMFNLGFGAVPRLLPEATIFFPNRLWRWAYGATTGLPPVRSLLRRIGA
jgi:hypothetical protein